MRRRHHYIDENKGELLYRSYSIEQLSENSSHLEFCYCPTANCQQTQLSELEELVTRHIMVHAQTYYFYRGSTVTPTR